ncbi:MAG TPA: chemotaxis protein CheW [Pyrinomonadaceae bacterium]|nr:chemotaxis protein CheW [Pyrinomonadaceae bacterium]
MTSDAETNQGATGANAGEREGGSRALRELFVFRAGARSFALFREEVEATAENLRPAPLPFAPPPVLGVVALRGRVRTAIDPLKLFAAPAVPAGETSPAKTEPPHTFVALAGDEQLALACDSVEESFTISTAELRPAPDPEAPARGLVMHEARDIIVLDPARLFDAATRGLDRRRKRS